MLFRNKFLANNLKYSILSIVNIKNDVIFNT